MKQSVEARTGTLVAGDLLTLFAFGLIGRANHGMAAFDVPELLATTLPFVAGWFLVAPWFGLFRARVAASQGSVAVRTLMAWVPIGFPFSVLVWALVRGRSIPDQISPGFVVAAGVATTLLLLGWRVAYALARRTHSAEPAGNK